MTPIAEVRPFDPDEMLEFLGGDKLLAREVTALFLDECRKLLLAIKTAIDSGDAHQVYIAAHSLKGAAGNLTARRLAEAAGGLEALGRESSLAGVDAHWQRLESEANQVLEVLSR